MSSEQNQVATAGAQSPEVEPILTLSQFIAADHRRMVAEYGVALAEVERLYPRSFYIGQWWSYVVNAFEAGRDFTPQAIRTLSRAEIRDLTRTTRGLRHGIPANLTYRIAGLCL